MAVTCPACAARYRADESKLRGKTARMRCRACDTVWLVSGPPSSEKRAAVVRRGAERERRDLFASRPLDTGSVRQTLRPPPPGFGAGARNENSVLFTVESIREAARLKTPEPARAEAARAPNAPDDEGVIDLFALSSAPPPGRAVPQLFASEPPPGAFAREVGASSMRPAAPGGRFEPRMLAGIAAAAVAVILCGLGIAFAFRGEEPAPVVAAPPPPPMPTVAATAALVAAAEPKVEAASAPTSDEAAATDGATKKAHGKVKRGRGKPGKAKGGASSKPAAPKPAPKAADPCHCKGDFNCILRCSAKGK